MAAVWTRRSFGQFLQRGRQAPPTPQDRLARALAAGLRARRKLEKEQARPARLPVTPTDAP
jgi:hypothetical protein